MIKGAVMERRLALRKKVDVRVYLSGAGVDGCSGFARDISNSGIYLRINPLELPRNTVLDLTFALHLESSNIVRLRRVPAIVTHSRPDGVGMRFCRRSREHRRSA